MRLVSVQWVETEINIKFKGHSRSPCPQKNGDNFSLE